MAILSLYSASQWLLVLLASFIIGLSKAGLKGIDLLSGTLMAFVFGSKSSTGIVLPLLCLADIAAWHITNNMCNGIIFRKVMALIILTIIVIIFFMGNRKSNTILTHKAFVISTGISAGFTTLLGNLAGGIC